MEKAEISILIPTYNNICVALVSDLQKQAEALGIDYEIIVADDGSTDKETTAGNMAIQALPHCQYIIRQQNTGRACIRNFLAHEAQYAYVLFIDSDMTVKSADFLKNYMTCSGNDVIDGGISIAEESSNTKGNLRYEYEKAHRQLHEAAFRQKSPYHHLHTANLMMRRDIVAAHPFDERFRHYGYEDVLFGKALKQNGIPILHIDNPLGFDVFETNADFVAKTEEGLRTLHEFRNELRGYSNLLTLVNNLDHVIPTGLVRLWHRLMGAAERRHLCGSHPSLRIFNLYRLGYYLSITPKH